MYEVAALRHFSGGWLWWFFSCWFGSGDALRVGLFE
ncbi:hypothetical protein BVRB_9g213960 [Beta vulgaris subsp. vulgaris]|nr:hypothetical protein BVRB_9g213960 [Beta vulgaris subsp. vulgaris]